MFIIFALCCLIAGEYSILNNRSCGIKWPEMLKIKPFNEDTWSLVLLDNRKHNYNSVIRKDALNDMNVKYLWLYDEKVSNLPLQMHMEILLIALLWVLWKEAHYSEHAPVTVIPINSIQLTFSIFYALFPFLSEMGMVFI